MSIYLGDTPLADSGINKASTDLTNVNASGTSLASGWAMPSSRYIDLTLGASGSTYTAPANGWFTFRFSATSAGAWFFGEISETKLTKQQSAYGSEYQIGTTFPVLKGQTLILLYSNVDATPLLFRFIYAEGEN